MIEPYCIPLDPQELQAIRESVALSIQQSLDHVISSPPALPDINGFDAATVLRRLWSVAETNPHVRQAILEAIR